MRGRIVDEEKSGVSELTAPGKQGFALHASFGLFVICPSFGRDRSPPGSCTADSPPINGAQAQRQSSGIKIRSRFGR